MKRWILSLIVALGVSGAAHAQFTLDTSGKTPTNVEGLWWNASQAGWGLVFTQQFHILFVTLYTYDANGAPMWYVVSDCRVSGNTCSGTLFRTLGGQALTRAWTGGVNSIPVGSFTATFTGNSDATISYSIDGVASSKAVTRTVYNTSGPSAPPPVETARQKTERLVGGTWTFIYQILSTFTQRYQFSTVQASTANTTDWIAIGSDEFGDPVVGGYVAATGQWAVLDQSIILDRFYVFNFNNGSINGINGCYYQLSPPGSTNLGTCYALAGARSPAKAFEANGTNTEQQELREAEAGEKAAPGSNPEVLDLYLRLKALAVTLKPTR